MPFRIKRSESIRKGLERVVRERLNDVLAALDDDLTDPNVHTARRRLKEVRATLRLIRRDLGDDVFNERTGRIATARALYPGFATPPRSFSASTGS